jgi:anti-anti-sigma factor
MAIGADVSGPTIDVRPANHLRIVPDHARNADDQLEVHFPRAGVAVVVLLGEHDLSTTDALRERLSRLVVENDLVVVDLSQAAFIDASTLGTFVHADQAARLKGGRLRLLVGAEGIVHRVLEVTNLLRVLDCVPSRAAALSWPTVSLADTAGRLPAA